MRQMYSNSIITLRNSNNIISILFHLKSVKFTEHYKTSTKYSHVLFIQRYYSSLANSPSNVLCRKGSMQDHMLHLPLSPFFFDQEQIFSPFLSLISLTFQKTRNQLFCGLPPAPAPHQGLSDVSSQILENCAPLAVTTPSSM